MSDEFTMEDIKQDSSDASVNDMEEFAPGQLVDIYQFEGKQIPIDSKLELHQSLETQLIFDIPINSKNLKGVIEEGPFITKLLFYPDREIYLLK